MTKQSEKKTGQSQISKFRDADRELECDESAEHFDAALKKVATAPPPKDSKADRKKSD